MNLFRRKPKCTCGPWPTPSWNSQDYNKKWIAMRKCPIHSIVPDKETKRYEPQLKTPIMLRQQKDFGYFPSGYGVFQAVGRKKVGIKAFDQKSLIRAIASFPTREDARAYLLQILETVKREQKAGIRSKRNLDPGYENGLDFLIAPIITAAPRILFEGRGWELSTDKPLDKRRKLTDNGKAAGGGGRRNLTRDAESRRKGRNRRHPPERSSTKTPNA